MVKERELKNKYIKKISVAQFW